jgi:geranylgeranylglycerol-phosphate geranylgeranyltransferase
MLKKLKAIWELTRLEHGIIYALGLLLSLIIAYERLPDAQVAVAGMLGAILAEMGAFALNDYFDVDVDVKNNRLDRPIVRGDITKSEALLIFVITSLLSVVSISFMGYLGATIVLVALVIFGVLYNYKLKEYGVWGNVYISFTMASPFLFGSVLFASSGVLIVLAVMAFLIGLGREIMKGIMDVEGDAIRNVRTIARTLGKTKAKYMAVGLYAAGVVLSPIPYFFSPGTAFYHDSIYALFAFLAVATLCYVCYALLRSHDVKTIGRMRKVTLAAMMFALAAFLLASLF